MVFGVGHMVRHYSVNNRYVIGYRPYAKRQDSSQSLQQIGGFDRGQRRFEPLVATVVPGAL